MKATELKLKKLKTREVYKFKNENVFNSNGIDPTLTNSLLCMVGKALVQPRAN